MAKTVQLSDKAYVSLRANKRPNESFSDVVLRLLGAEKDPMRLLELRVDPDWDYEEVRRRMSEADERRWKELWE